jgi:hypothetical protein
MIPIARRGRRSGSNGKPSASLRARAAGLGARINAIALSLSQALSGYVLVVRPAEAVSRIASLLNGL